MSENSIANTELQSAKNKTSRLFFIDNWKTWLITLVVLHHLALVYGAGAPFYYSEPPFTDPLAYLVLMVFILFNQSWFMGAFFLISGYFTPGSFDRKETGSFLRDRLLRLGIPLVVFIFVLSPVSSIGFYQMPASLTGITNPLTWQSYPKLIGLGPLWFVAMLLIFDFGYAAWRVVTRNRASQTAINSAPPGYLAIGIFVLVLALASYLVRIVIPMGKEVLGFPTLSYLPQYFSLFILGIIASRHNWFRTISNSKGIGGFGIALVSGILLFPLAFSGNFLSLELSPATANFTGNGQWQSAVYTLWDSTMAVGICLGLITLFRRFFNWQGKLGRLLSQHTYTVYVLHIPIVVFLAVGLKGISFAPLLKFGMAAIIGVPLCFVVAYLIRKIPLFPRVL
ncbi:acyltransferase family protein [Chloroflexota bacterium]